MNRKPVEAVRSAVAVALALASCVALAQAITDPLKKSTLPGSLENTVVIPPLAIANTSTRSVPAMVGAGNTLPAVDFQVRSTGGVAPVTFSIVPGATSSMFEFVQTQTQTITPVQTAAEIAAAEAAARFERKPAGTVTRTIRFRGATNASSLGNSFQVQIRARDVMGASVTTTVTVFPFAPRIAPVAGNRTALETWPLSLAVQGLGNATEMRVESVGGCRYTQNPRITYQAVQAVSGGAASVSRTGSFRTSEPACTGLQLQMALKFPDMSTFTAPIIVTAPAFNFRAPQTYAFGDTWPVRSLFDFRLQQSHTGVCSGESLGTAGAQPVGVFRSGDDIAMAVRSGPIGTECDYISVARRLPDGFALKGIEFTTTEGPNDSPTTTRFGPGPRHYCSLGGGSALAKNFTRGAHVLRQSSLNAGLVADDGFTLEGWDRPLTTDDNVQLLEGSDNNYAMMLVPLYVKLSCVFAASNAEFIRLRINRVEFIGPPGVQFP